MKVTVASRFLVYTERLKIIDLVTYGTKVFLNLFGHTSVYNSIVNCI